MLFVGNQRGGAKNLANHLLSKDNDHVAVHEVRGFTSDSVHGAFNEAYAMSRGTKCKQFLFSLSINPPRDQEVSTSDFEAAIERAETRLGLDAQPRTIVFHEKNGRRHAHAVWSRIDADEMKAVQLSFTHRKLMDVSRELHIERGWTMPRGMVDDGYRDPKNFSLAEWQQAKRQGQDPKILRGALQDAWAISDSRAAFQYALTERGMTLARGDRRGFVVVDRAGGLHALGKKTLGVTAKAVRDRIGKSDDDLPSVEQARRDNAMVMEKTMDRLDVELKAKQLRARSRIEARKVALVEKQRAERKQAFEKIEARRVIEVRQRQERFRSGLSGIWDRMRGEHRRVRELNEREALRAFQRDRAEKDQLIFLQLQERQRLDVFQARHTSRQERTRDEFDMDRKQFESTPANRTGASGGGKRHPEPPRGPMLDR